jgi:hypothetical protein
MMSMTRSKIQTDCEEIVAILHSQEEIESVSDSLFNLGFSQDELSIQGSPGQLKDSLGQEYINPVMLKDNPMTPRKEFVMSEDIKWGLSFVIAMPMAVGMVASILLFTDIVTHSYWRIAMHAAIGGIGGLMLGIALASALNNMRDQYIKRQSRLGGFVVWILTPTPEKYRLAQNILRAHHADYINCASRKIKSNVWNNFE